MIKANELRIGDWVYWDDIFVVKVIGYEALQLPETIQFEKDGIKYQRYQSSFTPIPLTEEWLLKFGFELQQKDELIIVYSIVKIQVVSSITEDKEISLILYGDECISHLKYVHQLQNLYFALTGKELNEKDIL